MRAVVVAEQNVEGTAEVIVVNDGDTDGVRCNVISCAVVAVQWSHPERAMVLRGSSAEKRVPHSLLTGLESDDKWAVSRISGLYSMYRVLRGLYVGRSLSVVGGRRGSVDVVGKKNVCVSSAARSLRSACDGCVCCRGGAGHSVPGRCI